MLGAAAILVIGLAVRRRTKAPAKKIEIRIEPGIDFEATHVVYHVTVRNRGGVTARDVVITPRIIHGPFLLGEPPKAVPVLKPGTFGTATWRIDARGEPGELEVGARIAYRDPDGETRHEASVPPMRLDLRPPVTRPVYLSPGDVREGARAAQPEGLPGVGEHARIPHRPPDSPRDGELLPVAPVKEVPNEIQDARVPSPEPLHHPDQERVEERGLPKDCIVRVQT